MQSSAIQIKAFMEIEWDALEMNLRTAIRKEIKSKPKNYILEVDDGEYQRFLYEEFSLLPLVLGDEKRVPPVLLEGSVNEYECTIEYPFEGTAILFRVMPTSFTTTTYKLLLNEQKSIVSFKFILPGMDSEKYERGIKDIHRMAFGNLNNINKNVEAWNKNLINFISSEFSSLKNRYLKENEFFKIIDVKVDEKTKSVFTVPTIKKKIIPPMIDPKSKKFTSEPIIHQDLYDDILKVIYEVGKKMERKPSLYKGKNEEELRDLFLLFLETRYEGVTATGETFNREGKTDILLKYSDDGSNLFVAECKIWNGGEAFSKGINQLFDRYLTWSDSKTAIVLFVEQVGFTKILDKIKDAAQKHEYCVKKIGEREESSFSYIFHLPQDKDKPVFLEVMAFHFDKL